MHCVWRFGPASPVAEGFLDSHPEHIFWPVATDTPQTGQRRCVFGIEGTLATRLPALARLRRAWVSLVGRLNVGVRLPCKKSLAVSSANGATAFRHTAAVSESCAANGPTKRQFPFACSKNHSLREQIRVNERSDRLHGSHARLSRFGCHDAKHPGQRLIHVRPQLKKPRIPEQLKDN